MKGVLVNAKAPLIIITDLVEVITVFGSSFVVRAGFAIGPQMHALKKPFV